MTDDEFPQLLPASDLSIGSITIVEREGQLVGERNL